MLSLDLSDELFSVFLVGSSNTVSYLRSLSETQLLYLNYASSQCCEMNHSRFHVSYIFLLCICSCLKILEMTLKHSFYYKKRIKPPILLSLVFQTKCSN